MSRSFEFWQRLFAEGRVQFDGPPGDESFDHADMAALFGQRFLDHGLGVGGPPLRFVGEVAAKAARVVEWSAWYLVSHSGTSESLRRDLAFPDDPRCPDDHLSADLVLQYLPLIYQRARILAPADSLPELLADLLRRWPLSGVLADVSDAPTCDLEFGGHPGLRLLYAERLATHFKPAWIPHGPGAEFLDLVWTEMGKDLALLRRVRTDAEPAAPAPKEIES